jgi:ABC-type sugar transport system ATPase subunit
MPPRSEQSGASPHVELRNVTKRFGGVNAVSDVDLSIGRGEVHALVGENGAGKSTLGKLIGGVLQPDEGQLLVEGRPVHLRTPRDALALKIAVVAQEIALVPQLTVLENAFLGLEGRGFLRTAGLERRLHDTAEKVGLSLPADARVGRLRIADQQKVEIVRALVRDAQVIVMDEPTAALAKKDSTKLLEVVRDLRQHGTTVVYVSHLLDEVLELADTVTVLRDGRVVRTRAAKEETSATLVEAMLGRSMGLAFPKKRLPAQTAEVTLSVCGLSKSGVLDDVSFDVHAGEIVGIAGLVGSGRSEILHAIFGSLRRDDGVLLLHGKEFRPRTPRDAVRAGVALLPESRRDQGLLMRRSLIENMSLGHLDTITRGGFLHLAEERQRARELATRMDVRTRSLDAPVSSLSGGNQQKALLGKWLFRVPHVMLIDEPTRGVDVGAKSAIYELIVELASEGVAVVLVSSEFEEIVGLAHRALVVRGGRIVERFDAGELAEHALVRAAFATDIPKATTALEEIG